MKIEVEINEDELTKLVQVKFDQSLTEYLQFRAKSWVDESLVRKISPAIDKVVMKMLADAPEIEARVTKAIEARIKKMVASGLHKEVNKS